MILRVQSLLKSTAPSKHEFAPLRDGDTAAVQVFVSRRGCFFSWRHASDETARWGLAHEQSHELARSVGAFHKLSNSDVAYYQKTQKLPNSTDDWKRLVPRIVSQLGLGQASFGEERIIVEADGNSVHLPLSGCLTASATGRCAPVMIPSQDSDCAASNTPDPSMRPIALNCFARVDRLHRIFDNWRHKIAAEPIECDSKEAFANAFSKPSRFVLVGCHGYQKDVTGELILTFSTGPASIEEVMQSVKLPVAATVLCLTCFGGAGMNIAGGSWQSLPGALIVAGARAVISNRWQAWVEPGTNNDMDRLLRDLDLASKASSAWPAAEALAKFVESRRADGVGDPRQWFGWSAWSRRNHLR